MELQELLEHKPLYYKAFDPNRIVEAYKLLRPHIKHPRRVQLIGTNGKGSTGRAIAHMAAKSSLSVGHYTSPHILDFRERFWINGRFARLNELEEAHNKLYFLLGCDWAEALSYFEYVTLLAFVLFEECDLQVIEAGLGGEYDATSIASYDLTVVTPIGFDHSDFLGSSLEEIATTKLKAMAKKVLLAKQSEKKVYEIAKLIAKEQGAKLYYYEEFKPNEGLANIAAKKGWVEYLVENIQNAMNALDILGIAYKIEDLKSLELFGRFYKLMPNVIIDVGHNPLAASAIVKSLEKRVTLIFNILDDKDLGKTLKILKEKIEQVEIIKIKTQRATKILEIEELLESLGLPYRYFNGKLDEKKEYLVFGSFYVVEAFLKQMGIQEIKPKFCIRD